MINPELLVLNPDQRRPAAQWRRLSGCFPPQFLGTCLCLSILLIAGSFISARAQTPPPVLISEPASTRAIALESVSFMPEPFKLISPYSAGPDRRTRIMLFALNLSLQPGANLSSVTADAEDAAHRHYNLLVEYVGPVPEQQWLTAIIVRLSDDLDEVGDVLIRVSHQGIASNRVRVAIGHKGGGPPDDSGAAPTPAPPYLIIGQVAAGGAGLSGVLMKLNGPQAATTVTDASGAYQFMVLAAGGTYTITPEKSYYDFSASPTFNNLSNNQTNVNFTAARQAYAINGYVLDETGRGVDGIQMTVRNEAGTTLGTGFTAGGGSYSFANLPAGFGYTVTADSSFFTFTPRNTTLLTGNLTFHFNGARRSYTINGRTMNATGGAIGGVTVSLSGYQAATVTSDNSGVFSFSGLPAGRDYTLTPSTTAFYTFTAQSINNLGANQTADFTGTLRKYSISGRITNGTSGLGAVNIQLSGSQSGSTVTDSNGNFLFTDLPAAGNYTLTPSTTAFYTFTAQSISNLSANQTANFTGSLRKYSISGRITGGTNGLGGVNVQLSGSQSGNTVTDSNGNFLFVDVPAAGNYTLTPSTTPFYTFTAQSINNLSGNQTANFTGVLRKYSIGGRITNGINANAVPIQLSGSQSGTTFTDNNGNFLFSNLPAAGNYTLTPSTTAFYTFTGPQSISNLSSNQTVNFTGTVRKYSIRGRINEEGNNLAGVSVTLSGSQQASTTTDSSGNYTFTNVNAGGNYRVVPAKSHYIFTPASQVFNNLNGDWTANLTGLFRYFISGRVEDSSGQGLAGVTITVGGSQSTTSVTAGDGTYSFPVPPGGNYTVTPAIEQDWYTFSPANQNLLNLINDQTVNFTATLVPIPDPAYVLEFDGSPKTVDYGYFWDPGVDLGHFFWEFWAMPGNEAGARYLISDGYGGAHAILYGFSGYGSSEPGRYRLSGNIFSGSDIASFLSDQGPAPGEWGHLAVGWDGQNVTTYFNGVPVGQKAFVGPRRTPGPGGGGSWLVIGGSDHNNLDGRIAQVRGYEGSNPREDSTGIDQTLAQSSFAPQTVFSPGGNLLSYYFRSAQRVADLSNGYGGKSHIGVVRGTRNGFFDPCIGCPAPQYTVDATAPNFATGTPPAPVLVGSAPMPPSGALVFDSFSRANSTYVFGGKGGLGATEGGAAGSKTWQTNQDPSQPQPFGMLNGQAVMLANATYLTWIPTDPGSANLDIRVDRRPGIAGSGLDTGLGFRVLDDRNFFFAYTSAGNNTASARTLTVGYYLDGQRVNLVTGVNMPISWTTLRVITRSSGQIIVYADGTQVYTTTNSFLPTAAGAGLYNNSSGLGLVNRWDNFTVSDAP